MSHTPPRPRLRRELRLIETIGLSVAIMSPTLSMSIFGGAPAVFLGRAAPLAYIYSGIGVLLVGTGVIYLSRFYSSSGSLYGLSGATLGPRAGFVSGWAVLGPYIIFTASSACLAGYFLSLFLQGTGIWPGANYLPFALIFSVLIYFLARREIRLLGRSLMTVEGLSILVMVIILIVIVAKLLAGFKGNHLSTEVFVLPQGVPFSAVILAAVFGFSSFSGFEGAAALGDESVNPKKTVPRAITFAIVGSVVLYFLTATIMAMGFGTTAADGKAFANSPAPLFELAQTYVSQTVAGVLELGATVSAFSAALGTMSGSSRIIFAMTRDGLPGSRLTRLGKRGEPGAAIDLVFVITIALSLLLWVLNVDGLHVALYFGSIGTPPLLVAYIIVNVGAIRKMAGASLGTRILIAAPAVGIAMIAYLVFSSVYPVPAAPYNVFPVLAGGWLLIGLLIILVRPGLAARVGSGLIVTTRTSDNPGLPDPVEGASVAANRGGLAAEDRT